MICFFENEEFAVFQIDILALNVYTAWLLGVYLVESW